MKILAITQARMASTRLPGKVLMKAGAKTMLELHVERVKCSSLIKDHVVAVSDNVKDDVLEKYCIDHHINYFRGSENDVLDRFYSLAKKSNPDVVIRLTADCPLIDAKVIDGVIGLYLSSGLDYVSNTMQPTFPDGLDIEVFSFSALEKAWKEATLTSDREHVTSYIWRNSDTLGGSVFSSKNYAHSSDFSAYRLTVDEQKDFELIERLVKDLGSDQPWLTYVDYIDKNKLYDNKDILRNEGYTKSLNKEKNDN